MGNGFDRDMDLSQIDRWREELIFYGYQKTPEGSWLNQYNGAVAQLTSVDETCFGNLTVDNITCTFMFNLNRVPEIAKRLAEVLLFADEDYVKERYENLPRLSPRVLPSIFEGMEMKKEGIKDRKLAEALFAEAERLSETKGVSPELYSVYLNMSIGFFIKTEDIDAAVSVMPTGIDDNGFVYSVTPLFIDMWSKFIYANGNKPQ